MYFGFKWRQVETNNPRLTVLILLVTVLCCSNARPKHRQRSKSRPGPVFRPPQRPPFNFPPVTRMPTTRAPPASRPIDIEDDILSASIGAREPPRECIISYDQFVEDIVGRDWISPYVFDNDFPLNPGIAYKFSALWSVVNGTTIRRRGSLWDDVTGGCLFIDGLFDRVDRTKAIFGSQQGGDMFQTANRRDYFLSFDSLNYVIFYICYDADRAYKYRCPNSEIFMMIRERRETGINDDGVLKGDIVLNDVPWSLIEATFRNCLGIQFEDENYPKIMWAWENDDCAKPGTSAFERGASK